MKTLILSSFVLAALIAVPASSFAAMYAYVNTTGEVMTMDAANANTALSTAPNLHVHSGVMLVDDANDSDVVGDKVPGT